MSKRDLIAIGGGAGGLVASLIRPGPEYDLPATSPAVDLGRVNDHVQSVIDHIQQHDAPERFRSLGCEVIFGAARFLDPHRVQVNGRQIHSRCFLIATGSKPLVPPIEGLEEAGYLRATETENSALTGCWWG